LLKAAITTLKPSGRLLELEELLLELGELLLELDDLLLELGELLLELDGPLLELDGTLLELDGVELEELLGFELLLDGCDDVLLSELPLVTELVEDNELPDVSDDELPPGGRYRLLELRPGRYELDELLLRGGGGTTGGPGAHGGAHGGAQVGAYGGYGGNGGNGG
jgi:hypothetical protein